MDQIQFDKYDQRYEHLPKKIGNEFSKEEQKKFDFQMENREGKIMEPKVPKIEGLYEM